MGDARASKAADRLIERACSRLFLPRELDSALINYTVKYGPDAAVKYFGLDWRTAKALAEGK